MKAWALRVSILLGALGIAWGAAVGMLGQEPPPAPEPGGIGPAGGAATPGMDVLTRGPIHEAFAQPASSGGVPSLIIPQKPPDPIEEVPPTVKPDDNRAQWIGGYWTWAEDRKDFLWVSGVWRVPPPNTQWVAGYWTPAQGGFQWTPGFWSPAAQQQVTYYPPVPATSPEAGPTSPLPGANYFWIPGCYVWRGDHYAWQPGYWAPARENWVWVPPSYTWTPAGYVYCPGYWDYPLAGRGMMFAPVAFEAGYYRRPGFYYSPAVVIDAGVLTFGLFVRPAYCHYYYGDYYAVEYDRAGIYPWYGVHRYHGYGYDPLFTYYGCYYRERDPHWGEHLEGWHTYYREHPDMRPPHTMEAQLRLQITLGGRPDRNFVGVGVHVDTWQRDPAHRVVAVSVAERTRLHEEARQVRVAQAERAHMEMREAARGGLAGPRQLNVPRTPLAAGAAHAAGAGHEAALEHHEAGLAHPGGPGHEAMSGHQQGALAPHPEGKIPPHPESKVAPGTQGKTAPREGKAKAKPERER
jgi:hypothetical protein